MKSGETARRDVRQCGVKSYRSKHAIEAMRWTDTDANRETFAAWFEEHDVLFETRGSVIVLPGLRRRADCDGENIVSEGEWIVCSDGEFIAMENELFTRDYGPYNTVDSRYYSIDDLAARIAEPNGASCARILTDCRALFATAQGSTHNHQAWRGGYLDHVTEVMNIAVVLYAELSARRPLPFSESDILLVMFLHDIEKPWKYELGDDGHLRHRAEMQDKESHQRFRMEKLAEYGIVLEAQHENGLRYAEGELSDYTNRRRMMGPLAALAHMCDVASARLWFDHPMASADPWTGAQRGADSREEVR